VENVLQLTSQSSLNSSDISPSSRDDCCILRSASQHHNRYGDSGIRNPAGNSTGAGFGQNRLNWLDAGPAGARAKIWCIPDNQQQRLKCPIMAKATTQGIQKLGKKWLKTDAF